MLEVKKNIWKYLMLPGNSCNLASGEFRDKVLPLSCRAQSIFAEQYSLVNFQATTIIISYLSVLTAIEQRLCIIHNEKLRLFILATAFILSVATKVAIFSLPRTFHVISFHLFRPCIRKYTLIYILVSFPKPVLLLLKLCLS